MNNNNNNTGVKFEKMVNVLEVRDKVNGARYRRYMREKRSEVKIEFLEEVRYELVCQNLIPVYNKVVEEGVPVAQMTMPVNVIQETGDWSKPERDNGE